MKIKYAFIYFLTVLQCLSCNIQEAERAANLVTYKMVLYSDSTYGHPMDSLVYTNHEDTTYFHEKFQPDGYFRIYRASSPSFNEGKLKNGREIGHWRFYGFEEDENNRLSTIVESNYNDRSELHGEELIYYCIDGKLVLRTVFNYINGNEQGIEKEFYKSGALAFCC